MSYIQMTNFDPLIGEEEVFFDENLNRRAMSLNYLVERELVSMYVLNQ